MHADESSVVDVLFVCVCVREAAGDVVSVAAACGLVMSLLCITQTHNLCV
jgi:hypothetical protein